jgi:hypothetical protein
LVSPKSFGLFLWYLGEPSWLKASVLIVHGAAPTAVSTTPVFAAASTETSQEFAP